MCDSETYTSEVTSYFTVDRDDDYLSSSDSCSNWSDFSNTDKSDWEDDHVVMDASIATLSTLLTTYDYCGSEAIVYTVDSDSGITTSLTYTIGGTAQTVEYEVVYTEEGVSCPNTENIAYLSFILDDNSGITTTSMPVAFDSSTGILTLYSTDNNDAGNLSFTITASLSMDNGATTEDEVYSLGIVITSAASTLFTTAQSPATSLTYDLLGTAETIQYGLTCTDSDTSADCLSSEITTTY
jgi:hypothetical protein